MWRSRQWLWLSSYVLFCFLRLTHRQAFTGLATLKVSREWSDSDTLLLLTSDLALYIERHNPLVNSTATVSPTTTSSQTSAWANSSSWQSSLSSPSTIISSASTSENVPVEPTDIRTPPPIPSEPPDNGDNDNPAPTFPPSVSLDECDTKFGCPSSETSSLSQPTVPVSSSANSSMPVLKEPLIPFSTLSSQQAACTGLITSSVIFVTETTTIIETITLSSSVRAPDPTYITPVQPCLLTTSSGASSFSFQFLTVSAPSPAPFSETVSGQGPSTTIPEIVTAPAPPAQPNSVVLSILPSTSTILVT